MPSKPNSVQDSHLIYYIYLVPVAFLLILVDIFTTTQIAINRTGRDLLFFDDLVSGHRIDFLPDLVGFGLLLIVSKAFRSLNHTRGGLTSVLLLISEILACIQILYLGGAMLINTSHNRLWNWIAQPAKHLHLATVILFLVGGAFFFKSRNLKHWYLWPFMAITDLKGRGSSITKVNRKMILSWFQLFKWQIGLFVALLLVGMLIHSNCFSTKAYSGKMSSLSHFSNQSKRSWALQVYHPEKNGYPKIACAWLYSPADQTAQFSNQNSGLIPGYSPHLFINARSGLIKLGGQAQKTEAAVILFMGTPDRTPFRVELTSEQIAKLDTYLVYPGPVDHDKIKTFVEEQLVVQL